jgi:hypothetical protein
MGWHVCEREVLQGADLDDLQNLTFWRAHRARVGIMMFICRLGVIRRVGRVVVIIRRCICRVCAEMGKGVGGGEEDKGGRMMEEWLVGLIVLGKFLLYYDASILYILHSLLSSAYHANLMPILLDNAMQRSGSTVRFVSNHQPIHPFTHPLIPACSQLLLSILQSFSTHFVSPSRITYNLRINSHPLRITANPIPLQPNMLHHLL